MATAQVIEWMNEVAPITITKLPTEILDLPNINSWRGQVTGQYGAFKSAFFAKSHNLSAYKLGLKDWQYSMDVLKVIDGKTYILTMRSTFSKVEIVVSKID